MTGTTKMLSAAAVALSLTVFAGQAQAQFGPMGGMMGGMGMRGGGMGMMRGMGGGGPGMGSARYMMMDEPRSRRSRSREAYEEAPSRTKTHAKPMPAAVNPPRTSVTASAPASVQTNAVSTSQQVGAVQPAQTPNTVQPVAPVAKVQPPAPDPSSSAESDADNALPTRVTAQTRPRNCMTKLYLKDGTVILQDFCTLEQAVIKQGEGAVAQAPAAPTAPAAQPQQTPYRQAPAQLARNR